MTDEEIDAMTPEQLEEAISLAMEDRPAHLEFATEWWGWNRSESKDWKWKCVPAKTLAKDSGNIAVALLDRITGWGWSWGIGTDTMGIEAQAGSPDSDDWDFTGIAGDFPTCIARLFLRIVSPHRRGEKGQMR